MDESYEDAIVELVEFVLTFFPTLNDLPVQR
jgi:hypothetical protein